MITDYTIIEAGNAKALVDHVKSCMEDGWQPLGGIAVSEYVENVGSQHDERTANYYAQALVKYSKE